MMSCRERSMSHHDYEVSKLISSHDHPFYALIMAAMRQADTDNAEILKRAFPAVRAELQARYDAPGGILPNERLARANRKELSGEPFTTMGPTEEKT